MGVVVSKGITDAVSAITSTTAEVTFNKAIETLAKDDVTVTDANNAKKYIKSVTLSEDKKSATVEFYDALTAGDYKFAVKGAGEATLKFAIGEPATIEVAAQTIKSNGELSYKVLDENGLNITASTTVVVSSDKQGKFTASQGKITTKLVNESAFAELSYTKKDGKVVKSSRVTVKAEDAKATAFDTNWTLVSEANKDETVNYKDKDYKQDAMLNLGTVEYLKVTLKDQFGEPSTTGTLKYETLDASVAVVDEITGKVTPRKEGTAAIKVSLIQDSKVVATKTVELDVKAAAKFADLKVDSTLAATTTAPKELKVEALDQYGNLFPGAIISATSSDETVATVEKANGKFVVTGKKSGTATITVKSGNVTKTVTVTVKQPSTIADYKVQGFQSALVIKDVTENDIDETTMTLATKSVDAEGLVIGDASNVTVEVKDVDGKTVSTSTTLKAEDLIDKKGPFTVTVKVGSLTVFSNTFTVTDNRVAPTYSVKTNNITVTANDALNAALKGALDFGSKDSAVSVTDIDFVSSNEQVIKDTDTDKLQGKDTTTVDGTTTIYVDTVTINVTEGGKAETYTVDFDAEAFTVTSEAKKVTAQGKVQAGTATVAEYKTAGIEGVTVDNLAVINQLIKDANPETFAAAKSIADAVVAGENNPVVGEKTTEAGAQPISDGYTAYKFANINIGADFFGKKIYNNKGESVITLASEEEYSKLDEAGKTREGYLQFNNTKDSGDYTYYGINKAGKVVVFQVKGHEKAAAKA